ncbi:MAG: glycerol-3-phosphate acyltransferase [Oscillospiraceae bacterium]|nr:glycerol-3-phosphate acyltransferase [Oscillospiraceae bacterium]
MTCAGFISGSVMYAYFLPKWIRNVDVRLEGEDGNPGSSNAIAAVGKGLGLLCMFLDVFKAFAPVFAAVTWMDVRGAFLAPVMAAPVLGHAFSPLLRFKGGKAVSASFGSLLGAAAVSGALGILVISMLVVKFIVVVHPDSAKVVTAFIAAALAIWAVDSDMGGRVAMTVISGVVCVKHMVNPNKDELGISIGPLCVRFENRKIRLGRKISKDDINNGSRM